MITNDDLLKELSHKELLELSDFEASKEINQQIIDDSLNDALAYISSFVKIPASPTPLLKDICVKLTIIELKRRNNFPANSLEEKMKKIDEMLLKMASKKLPTTTGDKTAPKIYTRAFKHGLKALDLEGLNA